MTPEHIAEAADLALVAMKTGKPAPFQNFVYAAAGNHQYSAILPNIAVSTYTLKVSLGANATGPLATDTVNVVMFTRSARRALPSPTATR